MTIHGSDFAYKLGFFFSKIGYSIIAASIFYFIGQYVGVYIPRQQRKIKALSVLNYNFLTINEIVQRLQADINYEFKDIRDNNQLKNALSDIKVDDTVYQFENWYKYLYHIKFQLLDVIRSSFYYHDYVDKNTFHELLILEQRLMSLHLFSGYKILSNSDLSFADIEFQELFIHTQHLQKLRQKEYDKHKKEIEAEGNKYRQAYYPKN
jgi:hypothetical protein